MGTNLPKIALASVLKPIDDTRMFEKFGQSLSQHYEVHIIGFEATIPEKITSNIHFYPIFNFDRTSQSRWQASKLFLEALTNIQPDLLIVHAVELVPAACWYSFRNGIPLCYDVRENYFRNILYQDHYASVIKLPLALAIRGIEWLSRLQVNHYFIAERNYEQEFSFSRGKSTVVENKFLSLIDTTKRTTTQNDTLHIVYTGTISSIYGAVEAFTLMEKLYEKGQGLTFSMLGKVAEEELGSWLAQQAKRCEWFNWLGEKHPVPHSSIVQLLLKADFALLPYLPNKSTENCIPTKLYECLALGIPMIIQENPLWKEVCAPHQAALFIDFPSADIEALIAAMETQTFYPNGEVTMAKWEVESSKLVQTVHSLIDVI